MNTILKGLLIVLLSICLYDAYAKPVSRVDHSPNIFIYQGAIQGDGFLSLVVLIQQKLVNSSNKNITIYINSRGGVVESTLLFIEFLKTYQAQGYQVEIIANKECMSACFTLLQAANIRSVTYGTILMVHNVAKYAPGPLGMMLKIVDEETLALDQKIIKQECSKIMLPNCETILKTLRDKETYLVKLGDMFKYQFIDRVYNQLGP